MFQTRSSARSCSSVRKFEAWGFSAFTPQALAIGRLIGACRSPFSLAVAEGGPSPWVKENLGQRQAG
jgi:hypothetical protein